MRLYENNFLLLLKQGLEASDVKQSKENLKVALRLFNQQATEKSLAEVSDLAEFFEVLTKMKASELFDECDINCFILNSSFKLAPPLIEKLEEIHIYEKQQELMKNVLIKIRNGVEELDTKEHHYRLIRNFVSTHYLIDQLTLDDLIEKIPDELRSEVVQMYTPYTGIKGNVNRCPICHRLVENEKCYEVCHYYMHKEKKEFYQKLLEPKRKYLSLAEGIYRYTLIPAIGEMRIFQHLETLVSEDGEVQLYPNVDEYDIEVRLNDKIYQLDVKDYQNPLQLVTKFKEENALNKMKSINNIKRYLVIPTHRSEIYSKAKNLSYLSEVKQLFENLAPCISVISERELYKLIKKNLENES